MLEIKGFKTKPLALQPQLHEPHLPRELVPLGRELGEHLQDDLAVDGEVLVAQRVRRHDLHRILVRLRLLVLLQQRLQRLVPQAGGRDSVVYSSPFPNCITIHIHRHQVLAIPFLQQNAQLEQTQLRDAVVCPSLPSLTLTLQTQCVHAFIRAAANRLAKLCDVQIA